MIKRLAPLFALLLLCAAAPAAWPDENTSGGDLAQQTETWRNFANLIGTMDRVREDLVKARRTLAAAQVESERALAAAEVERLGNELSSLQLAWELWATGGADLQLFAPAAQQPDKKFDWREELQSVFEPILVEMRRLTERPRKIERLRIDQAFYEQRLAAAEAALKSVRTYHQMAPGAELKTAFAHLEDRWQKRRDDFKTRLDLVNFELRELLSPKDADKEEAIERLKELFTGRLLNLLLAVLAAVAVYGLFWQLNQIYARHLMRRGRNPKLMTRVVHLTLVLFAALLALFAGMAVLYARGDWILLGLLLILLAGLALTLQRSLPGYLNEARLMLNIGAVREGERVIYRGLPWRVQSLRLQATLVNPLLTGGVLRLPLRELTPLVSREFNNHEPWFPTRENDYVVLSDDTCGQVILQTPDTVQLRIASAIKSFPATSFMDQCPKNLSLEGFSVALRFGIDYRHQKQATGAIRDALEKALAEGIQREPQGKHLRELVVEFAEAGASSLDFIAFASFAPEAADNYLHLRRQLQRIAVDTCNEHGWVIPFNQMTVHLAREEAHEAMT